MSNISRRQFLKGAGVATLAVAAAGVLAGCSGPDVPDVPGVTTRPVTVIFMKDEGNGVTNVVGETAKIDVLKTENSVKVADIDKKLLPEDYHLENENAVVEIRKDDSKGEYIIVFVTDVTMTPTKKTIDVKLLELPNNFIEGMACTGGCIGGAGCLTHGEKNKADVDKYGKQAMEKTILDAISVTDVGPEAE